VIFDGLREVFESSRERAFLIEPDGRSTSYGDWLAECRRAEVALASIGAGEVVALRAQPSAATVARLWALLERGAIVGLLPERGDAAPFLRVLGATRLLSGVDIGHVEATPAPHPHYLRLREQGHAGLVLFTSGTTAEPRAAVHDAHRFLEKFRHRRKDLRTLLFLSLDHVGGLDTLLYCMSNGSRVVVPADRSPERVCAAIAAHGVEVLPTNPSFLNLLLLQRGHERHDLSSLRTITYGAEVMPEATLERLTAAFPGVRLQQKYGSTELGALRSRSRASDSTWVQLGGEGTETRVVDRMLEVRTSTTMLGYLNADSPVSNDGWLATGDLVEEQDGYLRILGRKSELINVGGEKLLPTEVESLLLTLPGVEDALVYGAPNALLGQIVCADLVYTGPERGPALSALVKRACVGRLAAHKVPVRVRAVEALAMGSHKKLRVPGRAE